MARGNLKIEVYSGENALPLPETAIEIQDKSGNVVEVVGTDINGQTMDIPLTTPEESLSMQPSEQKPYAEYDIKVKNPDFKEVIIKNVQLFPNTTAIQEVNLNTLIENYQDNDIVLEDNTLYGDYPPKIPEDDIKDINDETGFVVLDKPVIPQYIVVHNGIPSSNATNYWIPFKSYIKNVACSEIYSTWPRETIKANVLAIISFTLNRVYTEWYRSQGKYFTITSTTEYVR